MTTSETKPLSDNDLMQLAADVRRQIRSLIRDSVTCTCIAHAPYDEHLAIGLAIECDDHVETPDTHEFWGQTDAGHEWRIHLDREVSR